MRNDLSLLVRNTNPVPTVEHLSEQEFNAALAAIEALLEETPSRSRLLPFLQRLQQRPAIVFSVAAAIVVLVVAVPLFLLATREGEVTEPTTVTSTYVPTTTVVTTTAPPTTTEAPTTTAPSTTVPEVVVPPPPAINWTRVPHQPAFDNAGIGQYQAALVPGGPGLVGVGHVWEGTTSTVMVKESLHAAVFVSADGESWERIDSPFDEDGELVSIMDIAVGASGTLVAVGGDGYNAAAWVSTDGLSWDRVPGEGFAGSGILDVTAGGPGFVAVGDDGANAGVWVSADGYEWTKVEDDDLRAGADVNVSIYGISPGGPGLVAVGSAGHYNTIGISGAVWVSPDGYEWERLPHDVFEAEVGDFGFQSMTVHPVTGRIVAWGGGMWTSQDGYNWTIAERGPGLGGPPPGAETAWNGNVGVAAGMDLYHSLWVSGDAGANWTRVEPEEPAFDDYAHRVRAVAWFDGRWVVAGSGRQNGVIWIGTPEE